MVVVVAGIGFWGFQKARELGETMANPEARQRQALEMLGAEALPEGYSAVMVMSIPLAFDLALLSDAPAESDSPFVASGSRGFLYLHFPSFGRQSQELEDFFEGRKDVLSRMQGNQLHVELEERVARGTLTRDGEAVRWVGHRGRVLEEGGGRGEPGLVTLISFDCPDSNRRHLGVWFGPDPGGDETESDASLDGTVADPDAIAAFLAPLHPCR